MDDNPYKSPENKPAEKPPKWLERVYLGIAVVVVLAFLIIFGGGMIYKSLPLYLPPNNP